MKKRIADLAREPLVHFLLLGAAMFAGYGRISDGGTSDPGEIVVTRGRIEALATVFKRTWQRPPSGTELEELIRDYVREEVSVREARALGLDQDDVVIRRRLRQKLEFVSEDVAALSEPTDEALRAWLKAHPESFRVGPQFSFSHVYLSLDRRGDSLARDASQLLARLQQAGGGADITALGDSLLLERRFEALPAGEVRKQFGDEFAAALDSLEPGRWQGPIESGYGAHLVFVHERTEGRLPDLEEVRDAVLRDWLEARRVEEREKLYRILLERYTVTIEKPPPEGGEQALAERRR